MNLLKINTSVFKKYIFFVLFCSLALTIATLPGIGAQKIVEVREQNLTLTTGPIDYFTVCGVTDTVTFETKMTQYSLTAWDNGVVVGSVTVVGSIYDNSGNLLVKTTGQILAISGESGLPLAVEANGVGTCTGTSASPGLLSIFNFGWTIDENGVQRDFHLVFRI